MTNFDGPSLYFDAGVSGPSNRSAAVGPSRSTMKGDRRPDYLGAPQKGINSSLLS